MPDSTGDRKLLLFTAGPVACCTDGITVFRIIDPPEHLVRLPGPGSNPIIFKLDNRLVRVVDVRALFGLEQHESVGSQSKLIVAEVNGDLTGFWVDQVSFIISVSQGQWSPLPSVVPRSLFDAAFRFEDQLILHVDFNRMVTASPTAWVYESGLYEMPAKIPSTQEDEPEVASTQAEPDDRPGDAGAGDSSPAVTSHQERVQQDAHPKGASQLQPPVERRPVPVEKVETVHEAKRPQPVSEKPHKPEQPAPLEHESRNYAYEAEPKKHDSGQRVAWVWVLLLGALVVLGLLFVYFWPESESRVATVSQESPVTVSSEEKGAAAVVPASEETSSEPVQVLTQQPDASQPDEGIVVLPSVLEAESIAEEESPVQDSSSIQREGNTVVITLPAEAELIEQEPQNSQLPVDGAPEAAADSDDAGSDPEPGSDSNSPAESVAPVPEEDAPEEFQGMKGTEQAGTQIPEVEPALPEPVIIEEVSHIVVKGDTLWSIAKRYINDPFRYPELARLSRIKNPDLIYPGDRVLIRIERRP
jgi:chemotaxis signal transduction protein/LysM repeat protein